jgi:hypothetical protein
MSTKPADEPVGNELFRQLAATKDVKSLLILWRADEPALKVKLVPHMASTADKGLASRLVNVLLARRQPTELLGAVIRVANSGGPTLGRPDAMRLIEAARGEPTPPRSTDPTRAAAAVWAMNQPYPEALVLAKECVLGTFTISGSSLIEPASARVGRARNATDEIATALLAQMTADTKRSSYQRSGQGLSRAIVFLGHTAPTRSSAAIRNLLEPVLAALLTTNADVGPKLRQHVASEPDLLAATLRRRAVGSQTSGGRGLVEAIDEIDEPSRRAELRALVVLHQPSLYDRAMTRKWSDEDWSRQLDAMAVVVPTAASRSLGQHLDASPANQSARVMRVISQHGAADAVLLSIAAKKVSEHARLMPDEEVGALAWPTGEDQTLGVVAKSVLAQSFSPEHSGRIVGDAVATNRLPPELAPTIVDPSWWAHVLSSANLNEESVGALASAFYSNGRDHAAKIIQKRQVENFSLAVADALAASSPRTAFAGAVQAYPVLSIADRERLMSMLERHGSWEQAELVELLGGDMSKAGRALRARAIALAGTLAPSGGQAPSFVIDALGSSRPEMLAAALDAIAKLQPRDPDLVRRLRDRAEGDEKMPGRDEASAAMTQLDEAYSEGLAKTDSRPQRIELLTLLGAAARPGSIDELLGYVGPEAEDDHPEVKRAASTGLADAAGAVRFSTAQISKLADLLDGPSPEGDRQARETLSMALARARLEDMQALAVVFGLVDPALPRQASRELFGNELDRLITHAGLFANEESRGEAGFAGAIQQLDLMALFLARAAYVVGGTSRKVNEQIRRGDYRVPEHGALFNALDGELSNAKGPLLALHLARGDETNYAHPGSTPTSETMTTARENFKMGGNILIGTLLKHSSGATS